MQTRSCLNQVSSVSSLILLFFIVGLGALLRFHLLIGTSAVVDADEAIVGLMAMHISQMKALPVFFYGQAYMGSLESIIAAFFFFIFGQSGFVLKLVPLLFSLLHICLIYMLTKSIASNRTALIAALLTAIAPNGLILWSTMARGGFIEIVVLGSLSFLISTCLLLSNVDKLSKLNFFYLGFVLGVGWWINNQIVFYIAAIVPVFIFHFLKLCGFKKSFLYASYSFYGFMLGSIPFWYANLFQSPYFSTFRTLLTPQSETTFLQRFEGFFTTAMPIILGARLFWSEIDIWQMATPIISTLYVILFVLFIANTLRETNFNLRSVRMLFVLFVLVTALIFSISSFGWLAKAPRYLLPLYSVLYSICAISLAELFSAKHILIKCVSFVFTASLLTINLASSYYPKHALPEQPFIFKGERVAKSHDKLYAWLEKEAYRHIITNYWIGYRVAFDTQEKVKFTVYGTPRSVRIPEYEHEAFADKLPKVYVLSVGEGLILAHTFQRFGMNFRKQKIDGYIVIDQISPVSERGEPIPLFSENIVTSLRQDLVPNMIDANIDTRWGSGQHQSPNMSVVVFFKQPTIISGLNIKVGKFITDLPQHLIIDAQTEDSNWQAIFDSQGTVYDPKMSSREELPLDWDIYIKPQTFTALRLTQNGEIPIFDWSIAELVVYGSKQ